MSKREDDLSNKDEVKLSISKSRSKKSGSKSEKKNSSIKGAPKGTRSSKSTSKSTSKKSSKKSATKSSTNNSTSKPKQKATKKAEQVGGSTQRKDNRRTLDPMRDMLRVLTERANERVDKLLESGKPSRALFEAQRTLKRQRTRVDDEQLFNADLKDRRQINREFARVQAFLNDYTSTVEGAANFETDLSDLKGAFKEYRNFNGDWDTIRLDPDKLGDVFDIYRRVIESAGGWERAVGLFQGKESLVGFGSEVLINNIYDMVENGLNKGDIISNALDLIEEAHAVYERMASQQVGNYDYGIIFDDEETTARRNYFEQKFRRRQEGYGRSASTWI